MSEENIGEQFKGIAGNDLIRNSLDNVFNMQNIINKHATQIYSKGLSEEQLVKDPIILAHHYLYAANSEMQKALDKHNSTTNRSNMLQTIPHLVGGHKLAIKAMNHYMNLYDQDYDDRQSLLGHFESLHKNVGDYMRLYASGLNGK